MTPPFVRSSVFLSQSLLLSLSQDGGLDIFIGGLYDRNRALNGDLVAVKLNDVDKWTVRFEAVC